MFETSLRSASGFGFFGGRPGLRFSGLVSFASLVSWLAGRGRSDVSIGSPGFCFFGRPRFFGSAGISIVAL